MKTNARFVPGMEIEEIDINTRYADILQQCKDMEVTLKSCLYNPAKYQKSAVLQFFTELQTVIKDAQQTVITFAGLLTVYETQDVNEMIELRDFVNSIRPAGKSVKAIGMAKHLHHIKLIDLIEYREKLKALSNECSGKVMITDMKIYRGRSNHLTGCRSTYHKNLIDILPIFESSVKSDVLGISCKMTYSNGGKRTDYNEDTACPDRIMETLTSMAQNKSVWRCVIWLYYSDITLNRVIEVKNEGIDLFKFTIDRLNRSVSVGLLEKLVAVIGGITKAHVVKEHQRPVMRSYIKAHLNLLDNVKYLPKLTNEVRRVVLPFYYDLSKITKLQQFDTGTGLKDGLTTIQLIHAQYGQLTYNQGLGFEVK